RPSKPEDLPEIEEDTKRLKFWEKFRMAFLNLFSVPKKSILMILVFFFLSSFVALVYGAFRVSMSNLGSSYYYTSDSYFANDSVSRVIVNKKDLSAFTAAELAEIADMSNVKALVYNDYILDSTVYLRSVDRVLNNGKSSNYLSGVLVLPMSVVSGIGDLTGDGELPDEAGEALIVLPSDELEKIDAYQDQQYTISGFSNILTSYDSVTYTITGVIDAGDIFLDETHDYIIVPDEDFDNMRKASYLAYVKSFELTFYDDEEEELELGDWLLDMMRYDDLQIIEDDTIGDDEIGIDHDVFGYFCYDEDEDLCGASTAKFTLSDVYYEAEIGDLTVMNVTSHSGCIHLSPANYARLYYDDVYQITIFTESDLNVSRIVNSLSRVKIGTETKYNVVYPFDFETDDQLGSALSFFELLGMLLAVIATAIASTFLSYIIFRAVINTKMKDYTIFRTVGANRGVIRSMIYLEDIFVALFSFLVFIIVTVSFKLSPSITRYSFFYGLKAFRFQDYLMFLALLLLMSVFISGRYCNRIFKDTVNTALKRG
ncbi:MAG TPA: hypothetical protein P5042_05535, partial [Candidatus Izemoplasmatales bacterium]|nr:hypothetical protein [Candidatus Izemoplasmatales bacterium]